MQIDDDFVKQAMLEENPKLQELRESEDYYYEQIQKVMVDLEKARNVFSGKIGVDKLQDMAEKYEFIDGVDGQQALRNRLENQVL